VGIFRPTSDQAAPASNAVAVTKSDVTVLHRTRALYVGGAGDVAVTMYGSGDAIIFKAVPVGTILPIQVTQVLETGTAATFIVALY
jgi:hypothetical protein